MTKILDILSFCLIPGVICVIVVSAVLFNPAAPYWAQVGYNMDYTLNPCKYIYCGE
jgi:hypothetical protein|tara:strand:+ start:420 stop:587 length:168 start_codon:yes stop_codon:yes gene_type:complete